MLSTEAMTARTRPRRRRPRAAWTAGTGIGREVKGGPGDHDKGVGGPAGRGEEGGEVGSSERRPDGGRDCDMGGRGERQRRPRTTEQRRRRDDSAGGRACSILPSDERSTDGGTQSEQEQVACDKGWKRAEAKEARVCAGTGRGPPGRVTGPTRRDLGGHARRVAHRSVEMRRGTRERRSAQGGEQGQGITQRGRKGPRGTQTETRRARKREGGQEEEQEKRGERRKGRGRDQSRGTGTEDPEGTGRSQIIRQESKVKHRARAIQARGARRSYLTRSHGL